MGNYIKQFIKYLISKNDNGKKAILIRKLQAHLIEEGWFRSIEEKMPVDKDGNSIPWLTYSAISFLSKKVKPNMTVFEYGSGNSTIWWSEKVSEVVAYEHHQEWYNKFKKKIRSNVKYHHCALQYNGDYCKAILNYNNQFDIVVIDGRDRVNCAKNSIHALKENGIIIWDNSDREQYNKGYKFLQDNGFKRIDFESLGPQSTKKSSTAVFYRRNNCFDI